MSKVSKFFDDVWDNADDKTLENEQKAFENAMARMQTELYKIMERVTVRNFYDGYQPTVYVRTNQFEQPGFISMTLNDATQGDEFSFTVNPKYDHTMLDHSTYKIHYSYQPKKNKKKHGPRRYYEGTALVQLKEKPDEKAIMIEALGQGIHKNVGMANTKGPIWTEDRQGLLWKEIKEYINANLVKFFNEEYDKLS